MPFAFSEEGVLGIVNISGSTDLVCLESSLYCSHFETSPNKVGWAWNFCRCPAAPFSLLRTLDIRRIGDNGHLTLWTNYVYAQTISWLCEKRCRRLSTSYLRPQRRYGSGGGDDDVVVFWKLEKIFHVPIK